MTVYPLPDAEGEALEPEHQPREHPIPCRRCGRLTWQHNGVCVACDDDEAPF